MSTVIEASSIDHECEEARSKEPGARDFVLDTIVVAIAQLLLKTRGLITLPLIAKLLGTAPYGVWIQTLAFITLLMALLSFNLHLPLIRYFAEDEQTRKSVYSTLLTATVASALGAGALLYVFADPLSRYLIGSAGYKWNIRLSVLLVLWGNMRSLNLSVYRATGRFKQRAAIELFTTFGELLGICLLLIARYELLHILLFMAIWEGVIVVLLTWQIVSTIGWGRLQRSILLSAARYALPLLPAGLSVWILDRGDRFVIGYLLGAKAVGIYSANYALASLLMLFLVPLQITLFPKISALWDSDQANASRFISVSNKAFLTFAIPFVVGATVLAPKLLKRLGNAEIGAAGGVLSFFIAAGVALWGISLLQSMIFHGAKRTAPIGVITLLSALLNLFLNFLLIPLMGVKGAALATFVSYGAVCLSYFLLSRNIMQIRFHGLYLAKCSLAALLMGALLWFLAPAKTIALVSAITVGGLIYFVSLWVLRAIAVDDIKVLLKFIRPATRTV